MGEVGMKRQIKLGPIKGKTSKMMKLEPEGKRPAF